MYSIRAQAFVRDEQFLPGYIYKAPNHDGTAPINVGGIVGSVMGIKTNAPVLEFIFTGIYKNDAFILKIIT